MNLWLGLGLLIFFIGWAVACWYQDHLDAKDKDDNADS